LTNGCHKKFFFDRNFASQNSVNREYRRKGGTGSMQTRQAQAELTAYTRKLNKVTIPAKAVLHDFRLGPGHEGLSPHNPDVVSFHYNDQVYFNISKEILGKTAIVGAGSLV
jgi:hypothetical protein